MKVNTDPRFTVKINSYPEGIKEKLLKLRRIIHEVAQDIESIHVLEETLKWGEPSFLVKKGSTIRMDWKKSNPEQYAMYFKCTSKLVKSFKEVYKDKFRYESNRAIVFSLDELTPEEELRQCIRSALQYHEIKHLHLLGLR